MSNKDAIIDKKSSDNNINKFLVLLINNEKFCLNIDIINEIVLKKYITPVPNTSENCIGIMNLKGDIIPIIDISYKLNKGLSNIINEIVLKKYITPVPNTSENCIGIMNLKGDIIPIIDISYKLNKGLSNINENSCIVVINYKEYYVGIVVDVVFDVIDVSDNDIILYPDNKNDYIGFVNFGDDVYSILNYVTLLDIPLD